MPGVVRGVTRAPTATVSETGVTLALSPRRNLVPREGRGRPAVRATAAPPFNGGVADSSRQGEITMPRRMSRRAFLRGATTLAAAGVVVGLPERSWRTAWAAP